MVSDNFSEISSLLFGCDINFLVEGVPALETGELLVFILLAIAGSLLGTSLVEMFNIEPVMVEKIELDAFIFREVLN